MDIEHIIALLRPFWTVWVMLIFIGILAYFCCGTKSIEISRINGLQKRVLY